VLNIGFGVIAGLFLTCGIAFMREKMDRSVRNPRMTQYLFNVPQLGVIPSALALEQISLWGRMRRSVPQFYPNGRLRSVGTTTEKALAAWGDGPSFIAESFRATLASVMRHPGDRKKQQMILVTSPGPGEGKTTIASNLAMALAETGRKVLLIDADFRRPRLHKIFGLSNDRGFIDLLSEHSPLTNEAIASVMMATPVTGLTVLVNRALPNVAHKFLYSPRLRGVLERVRQGFDIVLLDTPPLLHFVDTRLIAPWSDGLILVLRAGATDRETALEACERIREDGLNLLGTVLNDWNPGKSHLKHHYYYEYSDKVNG
jgi:capsular exopolysaccharide synthesis family protein